MQVSPAILRRRDVLQRVGFSRETLRRQVKAGTFPAPVKLGARAVGWRVEDVDAWLESLTPAADKPANMANNV